MLFKICDLVSSSLGCDRKFPKGWGLCTGWGLPRRPLCSFCSVPPGEARADPRSQHPEEENHDWPESTQFRRVTCRLFWYEMRTLSEARPYGRGCGRT